MLRVNYWLTHGWESFPDTRPSGSFVLFYNIFLFSKVDIEKSKPLQHKFQELPEQMYNLGMEWTDNAPWFLSPKVRVPLYSVERCNLFSYV